MKKGLLIVLVLMLLTRPFEAVNVAKLEPVSLLRVSWTNAGVQVETDTGERGRGADLAKAFDDLRETADGVVFLDTVDRLLVTPQTAELIPQLKKYLRPGCNVCVEFGPTELEAAGAFLQIHEPQMTLRRYGVDDARLPILYTKEGRMRLIE
jgi:hypothetical protein